MKTTLFDGIRLQGAALATCLGFVCFPALASVGASCVTAPVTVAERGATVNRCPVADAGIDLPLTIGQTVTLDASGSTDADAERLAFDWTLVDAPRSSATAPLAKRAVRTAFVADIAGDYVFELRVTDGEGATSVDTVRYSTGNTAPFANAGPDISAEPGALVALDAIRSFDADMEALSFEWRLAERPAASQSELQSARTARAALVIDVAGDYRVELIARDGKTTSIADMLTISTVNTAPQAQAGRARIMAPHSTVQLDGTGSSDLDGDALSFHWALVSAPDGSAAQIADPYAVAPTLTVDLEGQYLFQLIVDDGDLIGAADTVLIDVRADRLEGVDFKDYLHLVTRGGADDTDGDGVSDLLDNCVLIANPPQRDTDGDGLGNFCDADLNNDGIVNPIDLGIFRTRFFSNDPDADFNGDGVVNPQDLGILRSRFFLPPGPAGTTIWVSLVDGDWNNRLNWEPQVVPAAGTTAIANVGTDVTITLSGVGGEVKGLVLNEDLVILNTSFTGFVEASGAITATGSTISDSEFAPSTMGAGSITLNSSTHNWNVVTLGLDTLLNNGALVNQSNGLTVNATATIDAPSSPTGFQFVNSQTLDGTGTIAFDGVGNGVISEPRLFPFNSTTLTIDTGLTLRGGKGSIGQAFASLVLNAAVNADTSGESLLIGPAAWSGSASLTATNGGNIQLSGDYNNGGGTLSLDTAGGSINLLNGAALRNATIDGQPGTDITINAGTTIFENLIVNADFSMVNAAVTNVTGGLTLNGSALIDAPASPTGLHFVDTQTLSGNAIIEFAGVGNGVITEPRLFPLNGTTLTIDPTVTIQGGKGTIGQAFASLVLNGNVNANAGGESILISAANWSGTGNIAASGGGAVELSGNFDNGGNAIGFDTGDALTLRSGSALRNATINGTAGTDMTINAGATNFQNLIFNGDISMVNGALTNVTGGLTINGDIEINAPTSPTGLQFVDTQLLAGTATITFNASANGVVSEPRLFPLNGTTLTIGENITVRGGTATIGQAAASLVFLGDLIAEKNGEELVIGGASWSTSIVSVPMAASMQAINDGEIRFFGSYDNGGRSLSIDAAGGVFSITNGTVLANGTFDGTVGTTLQIPAGSYTLTSMTFNHDLNHANGAVTNVFGGLTINGTSTINAPTAPTGYQFAESQTLTGTASIVFVSAGNSVVSEPRLFPFNGTTLTIDSTVAISGATATIGQFAGSLIMNGSVTANTSGEEILVRGASWSGTGTLAATNGGTVQLSGALNNANQTLNLDTAGGTLSVLNGATLSNATLNGTAGTDIRFNSGSHVWTNLIVDADLTMLNGAVSGVTDGLTMNGIATIVAPTQATGMQFTNTQTLGGTGEVVFDGAGNSVVSEPRLFPLNGTTLTIGSTMQVHGDTGTIGQFAASVVVDGSVSADSGDLVLTGTSVTNNGLLLAGTGNELSVTGLGATPGDLVAEVDGTISLASPLTLSAGSDVFIDVASDGSTGLIEAPSGTAAYDGTLSIFAVDTLSVSDSFAIFTHGTSSGGFATVNSFGLGAGETFDVAINAGDVTATVVN